ncbi:flagellar basal body-associated FliL family protein [Parvularcula sp. LCG005]|uniref:flagellar basal body-associated FliL family protein n=1 Tax=Parvularcula sp. LCG005 TaxID=3078805 RepID=UPI002941BAB5|nr:flagellar basal body-associated FliL family protein [Parvularcula sp. LCG005]WOI52696.1 flagellar basal body-associated FliL family protein [Parvularcula sp. LCG005]
MADDKSQETPTQPAKSGGIMSILPLAVVAAGATFGMVWMASAPAESAVGSCEFAVAPEPVDIEELTLRAANYVTLEPITVTLGPDAGAKHLRMTIALATPEESQGLTDVQFLRLRDRFLERMRTVDSKMISDPEAMPQLKETLLAQAQATLGEDKVFGILITDFLMK